MQRLKEKCSSPCLSLPCSRNTFSTPGACKGEPQDCRESAEGLPGRDCRKLLGACRVIARGLPGGLMSLSLPPCALMQEHLSEN